MGVKILKSVTQLTLLLVVAGRKSENVQLWDTYYLEEAPFIVWIRAEFKNYLQCVWVHW